MPPSKLARDSFSDIRRLLDRALEGGGLALEFETKEHATSFRMRAYRCIKDDRETSLVTHPPEDPVHGSSVWDQLLISRPGGDSGVVIELIVREDKDLPPGLKAIRPLSDDKTEPEA